MTQLEIHKWWDDQGFCGCGSPSDIRDYVVSMLERCQSDKWDFKYENHAEMFFLNWANGKNLLDHGSTIRCSWRTPEGNSVLAALKEMNMDLSIDYDTMTLFENP